MRAIFVAALIIFLAGTAQAYPVPPVVKAKDFSAETRIFADDATPEILLRYKNFSADWIRRSGNENFFKLKFDRKIISLMGSGIDWHVALNGYARHGKFSVLPSVGVRLYVRIRPRLDIELQFSGMTLGGRGHFTDFESCIKYFPQKNFSIGAGWRRVDFNLRRGSDPANFVHSGPFVGIRYDF